MPTSTAIRQPGPWVHRNLSAGGVSFHAALSGSGDHTVLFLHDFPLYWWSWRQQMPALSEAGYQCVAMDLRGFGGSDLQPGEVDIQRLATDVTSVLRAAGCETYTVVGAGMGGAVAWLLAHQLPFGLRSIVTVSAPHPLTRRRGRSPEHSRAKKAERMLRFSWTRRKGLQDGRLIKAMLEDWSAPANFERIREVAPTYAEPLQRRLAAEAAWETYRATQHIPLGDRRLFEDRITVPVWSIRGGADPHISPESYAEDVRYVKAGITHHEIPLAGHYLSEEAPSALNTLILDHLASLDKS